MLDVLLYLLVGLPAVLATVILALIGLIKNNYGFLFAQWIAGVPLPGPPEYLSAGTSLWLELLYVSPP